MLLKSSLEQESSVVREYLECVRDLIDHELVRSMKEYIQHSDIDCFEHSLYVSFSSFRLCKWLGFDYRSAARGAMLHDFFLYDWHQSKPYEGWHGIMHPRIALENGNRHFQLNKREQDVIRKHMWPLTLTPPRYKEAWMVMLVDKYCALMEIFKFGKRKGLRRIQSLIA